MRKFQLPLSPDSTFLMTGLISAVLLIIVLARMLKLGEPLLSMRMGVMCGSFLVAWLCVWSAQRSTGQPWPWPVVLFAVLVTAAAAIWITAGLLSRQARLWQKGNLAVATPENDAALAAATEEARASIDKFIAGLTHPNTEQSGFSVQVIVEDGGIAHVMWLQELAFDGASFAGVLGPDAAALKTHAPGDRVTVAPGDVEDWMFVEGGKLVGGYSMWAIRRKLSGQARTEFESSLPFKFE